MGAKSRRKGKSGELEVVGLAKGCGFTEAHRGAPMQAAGGERLPDVAGIPLLWSEAKRYHKTPIARLAHELLAKERPGYVPVLFSRDDNRDWLATLDARELLKLVRELQDWREGRKTLGLEAAKALQRSRETAGQDVG